MSRDSQSPAAPYESRSLATARNDEGRLESVESAVMSMDFNLPHLWGRCPSGRRGLPLKWLEPAPMLIYSRFAANAPPYGWMQKEGA